MAQKRYVLRSQIIELIRDLGFVPGDTMRIEINPKWLDYYRDDGSRLRYWITGDDARMSDTFGDDE